jgi:hypothetical protein
MGNLQRTTAKIAVLEGKARELLVLVEQAKRGNDAAGYEALLGQQAAHLREAQGLRPSQVGYQQAVLKNRSILDELNVDMAKLYLAISMSLPRWVDTAAPFDRDGQSAATLTEVDQGRKLAELRFDDKKSPPRGEGGPTPSHDPDRRTAGGGQGRRRRHRADQKSR